MHGEAVRLALVALLVSTLAAAEPPHVVDVKRATLLTSSGLELQLAGGTWLDDSYTLGYAKELASKRARVAYLEAKAGQLDPGVVIGLVLAGVALGLAAEHWGIPWVHNALWPSAPER